MGNTEKSRVLLIVVSVILFLTASVIGVVFKLYYIPQGKIIPGVSILNTDVGDLTEGQAVERVKELSNNALKEPIVLFHEQNEYAITLKEIEATAEIETTIQEAKNLGRQGSFWRKFSDRRKTNQDGINLTPKVKYNKERLVLILKKIADEINNEPESARLIYNGSSFEIKEEKMGEQVNIQETVKLIEKKFLEPMDRRIELTTEVVTPDTLASDLKQLKIKELIASYSTEFDGTNENRTHNIKVAAEAINGYIIFPGDVFSFNDIVGPRSKERDYKESLVIIDNEFVPGTGGGVCQVSSTLYNVVLLSNIEVVERQNHSRPVTYLPLGRDATVLDDVLDLKFKNILEHPIMIHTEVKGGKITIDFFGEKKLAEEIKITTTDQEEIPPEIEEKEEPGIKKGDELLEEGKPGYKITVWREVIKNGQLMKKEKISKDTYKPVKSTLYKGTGEENTFEQILPFN